MDTPTCRICGRPNPFPRDYELADRCFGHTREEWDAYDASVIAASHQGTWIEVNPYNAPAYERFAAIQTMHYELGKRIDAHAHMLRVETRAAAVERSRR